MDRLWTGLTTLGRALPACLVALLLLAAIFAPSTSIGSGAIHSRDAGRSLGNFGLPCSGVDKGRPDKPIDGHEGHAECICCGSNARDSLVAIGVAPLVSRSLVHSSPISIACHEVFIRWMSGRMRAWSSRAPPAA